jgi:hypothetical protein
MSKRTRSDKDDNKEDKKRYKIDVSSLTELTNAFSGLNINDEGKNDAGIEQITRGMSDLNLGPIKVVIMPFAHGGVSEATPEEKPMVEGMDVKLITSTSGTCTLMRPDSYLKLLSTIAARVKFRDHTENPEFDKQLLEYFNNFQNYTVSELGFGTPIYLPEINKYWHRIPSEQTPEGYVNVVSDTYDMNVFNDATTSTKNYGPIPNTDPLWSVIQPIAKIMNVDANDYSEMPLVIYMYIDQNGKFRGGITPNTYTGITLHKILHNTNESIKKELGGRNVHYVFADPNCAYGDPNLKFGGKRKYKKHTKRKKNNYKKKSRKVRAKKSRKSVIK